MIMERTCKECGKTMPLEMFPKRRAGVHKWMKNQMNRYIRKQAKDVSEDSLEPKRRYFGWEF